MLVIMKYFLKVNDTTAKTLG